MAQEPQQTEAAEAPGPIGREWSLRALTAQIGVSAITLNKRLVGVPYRFDMKKNAKLYFLPDVIKALSGHGPNAKPDFDAAKARKMTAEAGLSEIEFAKERGEVIELQVIEDVLIREYSAVREKLLSIPAKLAPLLDSMKPGIEAKRALLMQEIVEALAELDTNDGIKSFLDLAKTLAAVEEAAAVDQDGEEDRVPSPFDADSEPVGGPKAKAKQRK